MPSSRAAARKFPRRGHRHHGVEFGEAGLLHCPDLRITSCRLILLIHAMRGAYIRVLRQERTKPMRIIDRIYIDGAFVEPHGSEVFELINPATSQVIGKATLGDREDTLAAVAAAKRALPRLLAHDHGRAHRDAAPPGRRGDPEDRRPERRHRGGIRRPGDDRGHAQRLRHGRVQERHPGAGKLRLHPLDQRRGGRHGAGWACVGIITPWNSNVGFICGKLAMANRRRLHQRHQAQRNERDPDPGAAGRPARGWPAAGRVQHRQRPGRGWCGRRVERQSGTSPRSPSRGSTAVGKAILRARRRPP